MAARNAWIVAGIGAAAAIVVWLVLRGHGDANQSNPDRGAAASASAGDRSGAGASSASGSTPGPHRSIPPVPIGPGTGAAAAPVAPTATTGTLAGDFEAEPRDDSWASGVEGTLAPRMAKLAADAHVKIASVECRQRQCRVQVEAEDQDSLGTALTRLGEDGGLVGVASGMIIGTPTPLPDGRTTIDVYGTFER